FRAHRGDLAQRVSQTKSRAAKRGAGRHTRTRAAVDRLEPLDGCPPIHAAAATRAAAAPTDERDRGVAVSPDRRATLANFRPDIVGSRKAQQGTWFHARSGLPPLSGRILVDGPRRTTPAVDEVG